MRLTRRNGRSRYRRRGSLASASRLGQGLSGRTQRSGRRYETFTRPLAPGVISAYEVWDARGLVGSVIKRRSGWTALEADGTVAVVDYPGSRDAAAAMLGR